MRRLVFLTTPVAALFAVGIAQALTLPVETKTLKNGLKVLVHTDHSAPVVSRSGTLLMVRTFGVTFSPVMPSPRVEPTVRTPSSYTSSTATPSIFGSPA